MRRTWILISCFVLVATACAEEEATEPDPITHRPVVVVDSTPPVRPAPGSMILPAEPAAGQITTAPDYEAIAEYFEMRDTPRTHRESQEPDEPIPEEPIEEPVEFPAPRAGFAATAPRMAGAWTEYTSAEGLPEDVVAICTDVDGAVWVAALQGVASFDGEGWELFSLDDPLPGVLQSMAAAPGGGVMLLLGDDDMADDGIVGARVLEFDGRAWIDHSEALSMWASVAALGPDGVYRVAGPALNAGSRVMAYDGSEWSRSTGWDQRYGLLWGQQWRKIAISPGGDGWFADEAGVIQVGAEGSAKHDAPGPIGARCCKYWISAAPSGDVWAHGGEGVSRFDGEAWTHYSAADGLRGLVGTHHDSMGIPTQDGSFWVSEKEGVSRFVGIGWVTYTRTEAREMGMPEPLTATRHGASASAVIQGPDGSTWTIGSSAEIHRYIDGRWSVVESSPHLRSHSPRQIVIDREGTAWFVTTTGIARFVPDRP